MTFEDNKLSLLAVKQTKAPGTSYCTCLCFFKSWVINQVKEPLILWKN